MVAVVGLAQTLADGVPAAVVSADTLIDATPVDYLILVMEDGRIVERGSHAELLSAGGAFAKLYAAQFQGAVTDLDETGEVVAGAPQLARPLGR